MTPTIKELEEKLKDTGSIDDALVLLLAKQRVKLSRPNIKPSASPVTIVSGPPGSGKSTWVKERAGPNDLIIDLDDIKSRLSGLPAHQAGDKWSAPALAERNRILASLSNSKHNRVWLVIGAPKASERQWWKDTLGAEETIVLETPHDMCAERIDSDNQRGVRKHDHKAWMNKWFDNYTADETDTIVRGDNS